MSAQILEAIDGAARGLKQKLDAATGRTLIVKFRVRHSDIQFEYIDPDSDWHRLGPSHDLLELGTPEAWQAMEMREADMILANWRHTFRMG